MALSGPGPTCSIPPESLGEATTKLKWLVVPHVVTPSLVTEAELDLIERVFDNVWYRGPASCGGVCTNVGCRRVPRGNSQAGGRACGRPEGRRSHQGGPEGHSHRRLGGPRHSRWHFRAGGPTPHAGRPAKSPDRPGRRDVTRSPWPIQSHGTCDPTTDAR